MTTLKSIPLAREIKTLLHSVPCNEHLSPLKSITLAREFFSKIWLTLLLSLSIYVMLDVRYVRHNILLLRLAVPVKIGAVFYFMWLTFFYIKVI